MKTAIPHLVLFLLLMMLMACGEDEPATSSFRKGNEYADQGEIEKAIGEFTEAVRLDPQHFDAYLNMGVAYGNLRQYERAIDNYDQAIRLNPQHAVAYVKRGIAYDELGQSDRAIEDFTKAIRLDAEYGSLL